MPQGEQNLKPPDLGDDVLPRLRDLVMRCPCTVLEGIRWSAWNYRTGLPLGFPSSAPQGLKDRSEGWKAQVDDLGAICGASLLPKAEQEGTP
eukprot:g2412.t1